MKIKKVNENEDVIKERDGDWNTQSHRVLSSDKLLSSNAKDIEQLLLSISKKYNVTIKDAAFALTNVFQKMSH